MPLQKNFNNMNKHIIKHNEITDVEFGANVTVMEPVNLYGCKIGDNSFIGPFVEIQKELRSEAIVRSSHTALSAKWSQSAIIVLLATVLCL